MSAANALYEHMNKMYLYLDDNATENVFEGSKVEAFRALKISQAYYTPVFDSLTELGCIEQVQRGNSGRPSRIVLHKPPDLDEFNERYTKLLTTPKPHDTLQQQIDDVRRRLPDIDLNSYIVSLDNRLTDIEARLSEVEQLQGR